MLTRLGPLAPKRPISLAWLVALALGLVLASSTPAQAQKKRLALNVKLGANAHHNQANGSVRHGSDIQFEGRVIMPPQRQFKVGGRCQFSRGGIPLRSLEPGALRMGAASAGDGRAGWELLPGLFHAFVEGRGMAGRTEAGARVSHGVPGGGGNSPRQASLALGGEAATLMTEGAAEGFGRAHYQAHVGSGAIDVRQPQGRQVVVEVVNRRPRPAFLRLEGEVRGMITSARYATNAIAQIDYMRLRCGTPYRRGNRNVLVRGIAGGPPLPPPDLVFSRKGNQQLRIARGRHQVWLAANVIGTAVGVNEPEPGLFHDASSFARAELDVCLLGRRGGRC